MRSEIIHLADELQSSELETRNKAVGQVGLVLEKSRKSLKDNNNDTYKNLLPPTIASINLNTEEQEYLINMLCDTISSNKMTEGMIWALGKARKELGFSPLLEIIQGQKYKFNEEANWQALVALDNLLMRSGMHDFLQEQNILIEKFGIKEWIQEFIFSEDLRLQKMAHWLLEKIQDSSDFKYVNSD